MMRNGSHLTFGGEVQARPSFVSPNNPQITLMRNSGSGSPNMVHQYQLSPSASGLSTSTLWSIKGPPRR